jgi:hypothetical protein
MARRHSPGEPCGERQRNTGSSALGEAPRARLSLISTREEVGEMMRTAASSSSPGEPFTFSSHTTTAKSPSASSRASARVGLASRTSS